PATRHCRSPFAHAAMARESDGHEDSLRCLYSDERRSIVTSQVPKSRSVRGVSADMARSLTRWRSAVRARWGLPSSPSPPDLLQLRHLLRGQDVADADEQRELRLLDLALQRHHFVRLIEDARLVRRCLLKEVDHLLRLLLHVP